MGFTDGKPHIVIEKDLKAPWGGIGKDYFRCRMCGHRFQVGDQYRWIYTNGLTGGRYGGNPIVCAGCDGEDVIERWKQLCDEAYSDKFWWFIGEYNV